MRSAIVPGLLFLLLVSAFPAGAAPTWYSSDPVTPPSPDPKGIYCPEGQQVLGGSCECAGDAINKSAPVFDVQGQGWRCSCEKGSTPSRIHLLCGQK